MVIVSKTLLLSKPPQTPQDIWHLIDDRLATMMYLMQSAVTMLLNASPGALVYSCNMLLDYSLITEWGTITYNREALVYDALLKSNQ